MKIECLQHGRLYAVYAPSSFPLFITLVVTPVTQTNPRMSVVPDSCPATKSADHTFIPPSPYRAKPSPGNFWFGTDKLWTELRVTGTNSVEYVLTLITNDLQTHGRRWIDTPSSLISPGIFTFLSLHTLSLYRIHRCLLPTNQTDTPNYPFR